MEINLLKTEETESLTVTVGAHDSDKAPYA